MNLGLLLSKLSNLMLFLVAVLCSTENYKGTSLTNSCPTSNHASFLWKVVLPLDLGKWKKKSLKTGYIFVEERELLD